MMNLNPAIPADSAMWLAVGDETLPRTQLSVASAVTPTSGQMRFVMWTARRSFSSTQVYTYTGNTAAAATPTLCRYGLYSLNSSDDGTLIASTVNDTAMFGAALTPYTRSWSTPIAIVAGQRYAFAALVVSAATMPTLAGASVVLAAEATKVPMMSGSLGGQVDLPASFTAASLSGSGQRTYAVLR